MNSNSNFFVFSMQVIQPHKVSVPDDSAIAYIMTLIYISTKSTDSRKSLSTCKMNFWNTVISKLLCHIVLILFSTFEKQLKTNCCSSPEGFSINEVIIEHKHFLFHVFFLKCVGCSSKATIHVHVVSYVQC